jgi:hypothetical protein
MTCFHIISFLRVYFLPIFYFNFSKILKIQNQTDRFSLNQNCTDFLIFNPWTSPTKHLYVAVDRSKLFSIKTTKHRNREPKP